MKFNKIKFLIFVSISVLCLMYISAYIQATKNSSMFANAQENSVRQSINAIKDTVTKGLWEYDTRSIEISIKGAFKNNNIAKIMILDEDGKFVYGLERKQLLQVIPLTSFFSEAPSEAILLRIQDEKIAGQLIFLYNSDLNLDSLAQDNGFGILQIMLIILLVTQAIVIAWLLLELSSN